MGPDIGGSRGRHGRSVRRSQLAASSRRDAHGASASTSYGVEIQAVYDQLSNRSHSSRDERDRVAHRPTRQTSPIHEPLSEWQPASARRLASASGRSTWPRDPGFDDPKTAAVSSVARAL